MLLILAAALVAGAASAQNVEKVVEKYSGKEGVTVIMMEGDMLKVLGGKDGVKINGVDASGVVRDVKTVTMIVNENGDAELARELRLIVDGKEYTPLMDIDSSGDKIRIVKGERNGDGEMVFSIDEGEGKKNVLIKIVGDIDPEAVAKAIVIEK